MTMTVFENLILIRIDFYDFFFSILSLVLVSIEKIYQTPRQCLTTFPNTSKFVKSTPLRVVFPTLFPALGNVVKHGLSCLISYLICDWDVRG